MSEEAPSGPTVFVGNLSADVTNEQLVEFLNKDNKFKVTAANAKIIKTSNSRKDSRVFAFVQVSNEAEIQKAIDLFNDQEFQGQKLKVQVALPPRERKPRQPRQKKEDGAADNGDAAAAGEGDQKKRRRIRRRRPATEGGAPAEGGASAPAGDANAAGAAPRRRKIRRAPRKEGDAPEGNNNNSGNNNNNNAEKKERPPRPARTEEAHERIDPTNTLFVANLPFSVDDDALKAFMTIPNGTVTVARIVRVRYNNRSKGFGFVSYDSTTSRDAALAEKNGKELEGRVLSISVAKEEKPTKKENN